MFSSLRRLPKPHARRRPAPPRRAFRPSLEPLEDRLAPAVFNVNSLADLSIAGGVNPDGTIIGQGNTVTLRSAIQAANANSGAGGNTINLTLPGTYRITQVGAAGETDNLKGEFSIVGSGGNLAIVNTSGGAAAVDGGGHNRVFDISVSPTTMQGFTITGGVAADPANPDGATSSGGGIRDQGNASLTLNNMVVTGNLATADGGGVSVEHLPAGGPWTLTVNNTLVSNNHAGDAGGGLETDGAGKVIVAGGQITGNTSFNQGAGIWLGAISTDSAALTMTGTLVAHNAAENGPTGAIGNTGNGAVAISNCTVEYNSSGTSGGGFGDENNLGTLSVFDSIFLGNSAGNGGGIQEGGPSTVIVRSLLQGNTATIVGGGLVASGAQLLLENSTVAGNTAGVGGGGVQLQTTGTGATASVIVNTTIAFNSALNNAGANGGGIDAPAAFTGAVTLLNDTLNANFARSGGGVYWQGAVGSTFSVQNTIIAGNTAPFSGPDAFNAVPSVFSDAGGNVIGIGGALGGNSGFTAATTQTGTFSAHLDPLLGLLALHGGPTVGSAGFTADLFTEAPRPHSPAIDKGVAAGAPPNDERGVTRPDAAGENPDVGAFETQVKENFTFVLNADGSLTEVAAGGASAVLSPAGTVLSITSVTDDAGFDVVFAITSDSHLWEHSDLIPGGWMLLSSGSFLSITAAVNPAGDAIVAAVLTDHSLWENSSLITGGWEQLSPAGTILSASAATDSSQGFPQEVIYAITVAGPNNLWVHNALGWMLLSVGSFQQISAGVNAAGQAILFGVLTDNSLWEYNPAFNIGANLINLSPAGTILAAPAGAADQVFAITSDHHLWTHTPSGWALLSVGIFEQISANATATAGEVFGVLSDGSLWEFNPFFPSAGHFLEILTGGAAFASAPQRY